MAVDVLDRHGGQVVIYEHVSWLSLLTLVFLLGATIWAGTSLRCRRCLSKKVLGRLRVGDGRLHVTLSPNRMSPSMPLPTTMQEEKGSQILLLNSST